MTAGRQELEQKKLASFAGWVPSPAVKGDYPGQRVDESWSRRNPQVSLYGYLTMLRRRARYPYSGGVELLLLQLLSPRCPGWRLLYDYEVLFFRRKNRYPPFAARIGIHQAELASYFCSSSIYPMSKVLERYPSRGACELLLLQLSSTRCPGSSMFTARYGIHSEELANFFCSSSCLPAAQDISSSEACERFLLQFLSTRCPRKLSWTAGRQEMEQKKFASSAGWTPFQDLGQRVDRAGA